MADDKNYQIEAAGILHRLCKAAALSAIRNEGASEGRNNYQTNSGPLHIHAAWTPPSLMNIHAVIVTPIGTRMISMPEAASYIAGRLRFISEEDDGSEEKGINYDDERDDPDDDIFPE